MGLSILFLVFPFFWVLWLFMIGKVSSQIKVRTKLLELKLELGLQKSESLNLMIIKPFEVKFKLIHFLISLELRMKGKFQYQIKIERQRDF